MIKMSCYRKFIRFLDLLIFEIVFVLYTEGVNIDDQLKEFDQFVKHTVKCRNIPSVAVSLVKEDKVIFSRGYGFTDIAKGTKATEHTKFCIGSLTKAFTSTILADILSKENNEFDQFVKHTVKCRNIPRVAVSLVKEDEVVFSRGLWFSDVPKGTKATEHTKFYKESLTKTLTFTCTLLADILSKVHVYNLSWNTRLRDILGPTFELSDQLRTDNANIRDILSHRIGTPSNFHPLLVGFPANMSRANLVKKLQYMPALSDFRTKFHYSNYMYMLAGHVAEVITGESWENMVADRLFNRLGMHSSGFVDNGGNLSTLAVPYVSKNGHLVAIDKELLLTVSPLGPAGSIYSTASDMAKWMLFHLRRGKNRHGTQLVDGRWLQDTYQPQMTHPFQDKDLTKPTYPVSDVTVSYNMGWMNSIYRGFRKLWHSGGIVTFISQLWMFPDANSGLFVTASGPLSPKGSAAVKNIAARASDILLGLEPWLNLSTTCTSPAPWAEPKPEVLATQEVTYTWNISRKSSEFTGVYGNMGFGSITVYSENEKYLVLKYGRFGKMQLLPVTNDDFFGYYVEKLWFFTNSDGNLNRIPITFLSNTDRIVTGLLFPIDFQLNKTIFYKGSMYDSKTNSSHLLYSPHTSTACVSGPASTTTIISLEFIVISVCLYVDTLVLVWF